MVVKFQVYKKSSPNNKITVYLTKRDFLDHSTHTDKVEGVLLLDPNYVQDRNVYVQLSLIFRFGREDVNSMGYNFVKTLYIDTTQLYPPVKDIQPTEIQRNLMNRMGNFAFPFMLEFPRLSGPSYTMMQGWEDEGPLISMEYAVMGFVGITDQDIHTRSTASITVRRLANCPSQIFDNPAPTGSISKQFLTCSGSVSIKASLSSAVYFPEEDILVKVTVDNHSSREIKRVKAKVIQLSMIPVFSATQTRDKTIMKIDDGQAVAPNSSINRDFTLIARVPSVNATGQIFLQGKVKSDAIDQLAPSTNLSPNVPKADIFGVFVHYAVRIKATLGPIFGDAILDIPFTLAVRPE